MDNVFRIVAVKCLLIASIQVQGAQPIDVMIARGVGVTNAQALSVLTELNSLMSNSGLASRDFNNALGAGSTLPTQCIGGIHHDLALLCALTLGSERNSFAADLVILVVSSIANSGGSPVCGVSPELMINLPWITRWNHPLGYAVVSTNCNIPGEYYLASHEVLHLLSIEHQDGDGKISTPERNNHAIALTSAGSAGATPNDCDPNPCTTIKNRMSSPGLPNLPDGGPGGNSLHSNSKGVVKNKSWNEVANYRPTPQITLPNINVELLFCIGWAATHYVSWGGSTLYPGDYYEVDYRNQFGWWTSYQEGGSGSGVFVTAMHQTTFRVRVVTIDGVSIWIVFGTNENCMNGPPLF